MEKITSLKNPHIREWKALAGRPEIDQGSIIFMAEGEHMTGEALNTGCVDHIIVQDGMQEKYAHLLCADKPCFCVTDDVMRAISSTKAPQGIACVGRVKQKQEGASTRLCMLQGVQDPGNVGTILRTMDAAGWDRMIIDRKTADPYGSKAMRASMGAVFRIKITISDDLGKEVDQLKQNGIAIMAGELHGKDLFQASYDPDRVCVLIGNEGAGLSDAILSKADLRVKIPMPGKAESLNAGIACGIMIYDAVRRSQMIEK